MPEFKPMLKPLPLEDDRSSSSRGQSPGAATPPREVFPVPGFFGRLGALVIDGAVLSMVLYLLVGNAYAALYPHRWTAQVAAILAVYVYFWIGSSALTRGQTAGKWIFGYRVVGEDGAPLPLGRAAVRAALACSALVAFAFLRNPPRVPHLTPVFFAAMMVLQTIATAYAVSAAFFCGLHPKRRAPHDLWVRSVVVRAAQPARSLDFVAQWSDVDSQRLKIAFYPAALAVLIVGFYFGSGIFEGRKGLAHSFAVMDLIRDRLPNDNGFTVLGFDMPSEAARVEYEKRLRQRRERLAEFEKPGQADEAKARDDARAYAEATRLFERYAQNGERFIVFVDCDAAWTTESLVADPGYQALVGQLPAMAESVMRSPEAQARTADERPTSWTLSTVQAEFYEVLPLGLYVETRARWRVQLPAPASSADLAASEASITSATLGAKSAPSAGK